MKDQLESIYKEFSETLNSLKEQADVLGVKANFLGKKGKINEIMKSIGSMSAEEKKTIGPLVNETKNKMLVLLQDKLNQVELDKINEKLEREKIDITYLENLKSSDIPRGGYHPRTIVQREIEDVFLSMGFEVLDGPHVEDEFHNFEALNIPGDHPARDMQDTFWFHHPHGDDEKKYLLRTHTSTIQIRGMMERKPPFRFIAPGTVFRCERTDASHEMVFNQLEGMMVGKDVSVAHLIYFMKTLLKEIFKKEVKVRLRPGFFPFVEPGFELDINCLICNGKGCSVCKQTGWVELLPCGMVHPNVLKAGNIDPDEWSGFAFGLGLDRLVMMRYGIDDIRHFNHGDLRFYHQFNSY